MKNKEEEKFKGPMHNIESFGSTTLGKKGQVVIPAEIRKKMKLEPGDNFIVILANRSIAFLPSDKVEEVVSELKKTIDKFKKISKK